MFNTIYCILFDPEIRKILLFSRSQKSGAEIQKRNIKAYCYMN